MSEGETNRIGHEDARTFLAEVSNMVQATPKFPDTGLVEERLTALLSYIEQQMNSELADQNEIEELNSRLRFSEGQAKSHYATTERLVAEWNEKFDRLKAVESDCESLRRANVRVEKQLERAKGYIDRVLEREGVDPAFMTVPVPRRPLGPGVGEVGGWSGAAFPRAYENTDDGPF